jgi:hypothetical protein
VDLSIASDLGVTSDLAVAMDLAFADLAAPDLAPPQDLAVPILPTLHALVLAHPDNVVGALVDLTFSNASQIVVEWGASTAYGASISQTVAGDGHLILPVFGLPAGATTHFVARATGAGGSVESPDLTLATGPLPADIPTLQVKVNDGTATGYVLIGLFDGHALIVDRSGKLLWYRTALYSNSGVAFDRLFNGHYALYYNVTGAAEYREFDLTGQLFRS